MLVLIPLAFLGLSQLRTALHQLCQRAAAAVLRQARVQAGARRVHSRKHRLDTHRLSRQPADLGHTGRQTFKFAGPH